MLKIHAEPETPYDVLLVVVVVAVVVAVAAAAAVGGVVGVVGVVAGVLLVCCRGTARRTPRPTGCYVRPHPTSSGTRDVGRRTQDAGRGTRSREDARELTLCNLQQTCTQQ